MSDFIAKVEQRKGLNSAKNLSEIEQSERYTFRVVGLIGSMLVAALITLAMTGGQF